MLLKDQNIIEIGDCIKLKTLGQKMKFLTKNTDVFNIRYSHLGNEVYELKSYTNLSENAVDLFRDLFTKLNYRTYVVVDLYVMNDIKFVKIWISKDETLTLSLDYISKKTDNNLAIKIFAKKFEEFKTRFKTMNVSNDGLNGLGFSLPLKRNITQNFINLKDKDFDNINNKESRVIIFGSEVFEGLVIFLDFNLLSQILVNNGEVDSQNLLRLNPNLGKNIKVNFL